MGYIVVRFSYKRTPTGYVSNASIGTKQHYDVVFIGDSHTHRFNLTERFPKVDLINMGINGDNSIGVLRRLDTLIAYKPKKVFLMVGVNDVLKNVPVDTTINNIQMIVSKIKGSLPASKIFIQSIMPTSQPKFGLRVNGIKDIQAINKALKELSIADKVELVDTYALMNAQGKLNPTYQHDTNDSLHLNKNGYDVWYNQIKPVVN